MGELVRIADIKPETAISIPTGEGTIEMSVNDVLKWVARSAPREEALKFLLTCRAAQVNPFLREADLVQFGTAWTVIINKAGWLRRAEEHPAYEGFQAGIIVRPMDTSTKPPTPIGAPEEQEGALHLPGYQILGGWARVYRKDRRLPFVARVALSEYAGSNPNWTQRPATMVRKVALVQALREAGFLPRNVYDRDEIPEHVQALREAVFLPAAAIPANVVEAVEAEFEAVPTHQLNPTLAAELKAAMDAAGMAPHHVDEMLRRRNVRSIVELSDRDGMEILSKLRQILDQDRAGQILLPDPRPNGDGEVVDAEFRDATA